MLDKNSEPALSELKRLNINFSESAFLSYLEHSDSTIVPLFIAAGMNPNTKTPEGTPGLLITTQNRAWGLVKLLLESGAAVNAVDKRGWSALMFAAKKGDLDITKLLIKHQANLDLQTVSFSWTALIFAVNSGYKDIAEILINHGAKIDLTTIFNETALMFAARNGFIDIIKLLLANGADASRQDRYGWTAFRFAEEHHYPECAELLKNSLKS